MHPGLQVLCGVGGAFGLWALDTFVNAKNLPDNAQPPSSYKLRQLRKAWIAMAAFSAFIPVVFEAHAPYIALYEGAAVPSLWLNILHHYDVKHRT